MAEEPTSRPDGDAPSLEHEPREALPPGAAEGSGGWADNLAKRIVTGVPALIVVLLLIAVAPVRVLALVAAAAGVWGTYEYTRLVSGGDGMALPMGAMLFGAVTIGLGGVAGTAAGLNAGLLVGGGVLAWLLWFSQPTTGRDALRELGVALAGLLLVPWLLNHLGLLVQTPGGRGFAAFLVVAVTLDDTLAYLVGTFFGRWPLIPTVSPHKTVEGAVGGIVGGAVAGIVARLWMGGAPPAFSLLGLIVLGAVLAVAGQAGDLLESKIKRLTHATASGQFLPGHGGLLDRVDAYLLTAPLSFYLLRYLGG
jgi:phosphatidate cytidylyltransferase